MSFSDQAVPQPAIPETVTAGVPAEISFRTVGDDCVRGGDTKVQTSDRAVVVTPFDTLVWARGGYCPQPLNMFEHRATVVFDEPGTAEIVLVFRTFDLLYPGRYGSRAYPVDVSPEGT